jgi:hypothetical protein
VLVERATPGRDELRGFVVGQRADARPIGGQVLGEEGAHPSAEDLGCGIGTEIHLGRIPKKLTETSSMGNAR